MQTFSKDIYIHIVCMCVCVYIHTHPLVVGICGENSVPGID